jgi:hypothetical protein
MIATDRFVYLHLHKSGGTFINECLLRFFADARQIGYHLPRTMIPAALRALPVLGFVRNPWSYYVSWFAFQSQRAQPNALFRCVSDNATCGFKQTVRNLLELGNNETRLDQLRAALPPQYGQHGLNLPSFALAPIRGSGMGFYSYLSRYMYGENDAALFVGRTENLREDFLAFLQKTSIDISAQLRDFILHEHARNISSHSAWSDYYDTALAAAVAKFDHAVIDTFDYRFAA